MADDKRFHASDDDLPPIFFGEPPDRNQFTRARDRVEAALDELGLSPSEREIDLCALVVIFLEEIEAEKQGASAKS